MPLHARPDFLRSIRPHCGDGLVKVLTGLRRSGKSSLLRLIAADTAQKLDLPKEDFLFLDFEDSSCGVSRGPKSCTTTLRKRQRGRESDSPCFSTKCGRSSPGKRSSAPCRTADAATSLSPPPGLIPLGRVDALAGRTVRFEVTPYSFREFRAVRKTVCADVAEETIWRDYLAWGGMPAVTNFADVSDAKLYLIDVFRSILLSDVTAAETCATPARSKRRLPSRRNVAGNDFRSVTSPTFFLLNASTSPATRSPTTCVRLPKAGLLLGVDGADIPEKPCLRRRPKRFLADHGFREALSSGRNERDPEPVLKNIVLMELRRRGWTVRFARKERRRSTSSPKRRESVFTCRSAGFWIRRKPSRARSRPFTTSRTTGPSSSFPWIRCCVPGTAFGTKTFANGSSKTTDGPRAKKRPGTIGFVPGLAVGRIS